MVDLHLFLGRKATNSSEDSSTLSYTLPEMTPDMVHYGSLPVSILTQEVETVQRLIHSELAGSLESESLKALSRVCTNAMKQYRRTRPEASRDAVRRAKAILEGTRLESGQRIGKGRIPTHPLLRGTEEKAFLAGNQHNDDNLHSLDNFKDCEQLLEEIAAFRPKETVFEAFATGVGKDVGVASQVDRGRTTNTKKSSSAVALTAMRNMRRQMKTVRNKGAALVVAGSSTAQKINEDSDGSEDAVGVGENYEGNDVKTLPSPAAAATGAGSGSAPTIRRPKTFLSKAARRRAKKNATKSPATNDAALQKATEEPKRRQTAADFRDPGFYIDNDFTSNTEEAQRARTIEAAMQPNAAMKGITGQAFRIEEAMLDVVGDENEELVQKHRMMRWDKSKRKYVQTTVGAELRGDSKSKKMRLESGQVVSTDKMKLGELYAKWQKKTNRSIGRNGVFDDSPASGDGDFDRRGNKSGKGKGNKRHDGDGVKSAMEIKKERAKKQDTKIKNMKKGDRKRLEQKNKQGQGRKQQAKGW